MSLFKLSSSLTVLLGKPFPQAIHLLAPQEEQLAKLPPPQALALLGVLKTPNCHLFYLGHSEHEYMWLIHVRVIHNLIE